MKRFFAALMFPAVLLGCVADAVAAPTIVAFGDSTTAPRGRTEVYAALLERDLSFEGGEVRVVNAGIPGNTTANAKARFEKDVVAQKPDVVILQFGINDAAVDVWKNPPAKSPRVALADYRQNLTEMVRTLKQRGARVILMTPNALSWTPTLRKMYSQAPYLPDEADGMNVLLRDYAEAVRGIAHDEGVGLVDVFTAFQEADKQAGHKPGWLARDGMHPDDEGQRIVEKLIIEHLRAVDPRYARKANTAWSRSGEVNEVNPLATEATN
jgi:lysophospholipase L1-like esterase